MQTPQFLPSSPDPLRTAGTVSVKMWPGGLSCGFLFLALFRGSLAPAATSLILLFSGCGQDVPSTRTADGSSGSPQSTPSVVASTNGIDGATPLPDLGDAADPRMAELIAADELASKGRTGEAEAAYLTLLKQSPDYEEAHFNLGFLYARQGRTNDAISHYETAIRLVPTYAEAHSNLGNLFVRAKRFDEAIHHLQTALAADPKNSRTYNNLGSAFASAGQMTNAIPQFAKAVQLNPDFAEAWFNLGRSQLVLDRVDEAIAAFQTAIRLEPSMGPAQGQLRKAMERKQALGY
ncbi:MAG: tetratricopeptide repeat protein [Verrucomicrobia bacterium]|nr:tetratricopeptide repeat protein [Verrucomicrobiota bacterium]